MDHDYSLESLQHRLMALGISEQQSVIIINDVSDIILRKMVALRIKTFDEPTRARLEAASDAEIKKFFQKHNATLPKVTRKQLEQVTDETWTAYFKEMERQFIHIQDDFENPI